MPFFLPALGWREVSYGSIEVLGVSGLYWTSTEYTYTHGTRLYFGDGYSWAGLATGAFKEGGNTIRCVR